MNLKVSKLKVSKILGLGLALLLATAGPALGVSTEILRLKFSETVVGGQYANGQSVIDGVTPTQNGVVDVLGTPVGLLTQVPSPVTSLGTAMNFGSTACTGTGTPVVVTCPQLGQVKIADTAGAFSPIGANFEYGATIRLTAAVPAGALGGMNVVQKGTSGTSDMWKLSVDNGKAACIVKANGAASTSWAKATRATALTVGQTYKLKCSRVAGVLKLTVTPLAADGSGTAEAAVTAALSAAGDLNDFGATNTVNVGGKGTPNNPDQLRNAIVDNVTYSVG